MIFYLIENEYITYSCGLQLAMDKSKRLHGSLVLVVSCPRATGVKKPIPQLR